MHYFWPPPDPPPPPPPPPNPHRWFTFRPPFEGFQTGRNPCIETGAFRVARQHVLDPAAGLVGNDVTLEISDASDVDVGNGIAHTQIQFFFEAPATGLVEVVISAQSGLATHDLRTEDEWGWSQSDTRQRNSLMMHVLHPNVTGPSFALMSTFEYKTDTSRHEHFERFARASNHAAHLFSDGPVPAGQWFAIRVGTATNDWAFTNDMELYSTSRFHWFIRAIHVRIAE